MLLAYSFLGAATFGGSAFLIVTADLITQVKYDFVYKQKLPVEIYTTYFIAEGIVAGAITGGVLGIISSIIDVIISPAHDSEQALPLNGESPLDPFPDLG